MGGLLAAGLATEVLVLAMLCFAASALGIVGVVRAAQAPPRGAAGLLTGPIAVALVSVLVLLVLRTGWDPSDTDALLRRSSSYGAASFLLPVLTLPTLLVASGGIAWHGSRPPRSFRGAAWVWVPALLVAAVIGVGAMGQPSVIFTGLRLSALVGLTAVLSVGALREERPDLRGLGLGVLALWVAMLETSYAGLTTVLTVGQTPVIATEVWGEALATFGAIVQRPLLAGLCAYAVAAVCAAVAARRADRPAQMAIATCVLLGAVLLGLSRPGEARMMTLAALCPPASELPTSR